MKIKSLLATTVLAVVGLAAASAQATQLIQNGDFTDPNVGTGYTITANLGTEGFIPGWYDLNDGVEVGYTQIYGLPAYNGDQQLMEVNANSFDAVSQDVSGLTVGASYVLSWAYGGRNGGGPQILDVSFGGAPVTVDSSDGVNSFWTLNSFDVVATATTETLTFSSVPVDGSAPSYGNELDAVSLTPVPEPATWVVMMMGFGALGVAMRGARRKQGALAA